MANLHHRDDLHRTRAAQSVVDDIARKRPAKGRIVEIRVTPRKSGKRIDAAEQRIVQRYEVVVELRNRIRQFEHAARARSGTRETRGSHKSADR
jgi:hypothetical protein